MSKDLDEQTILICEKLVKTLREAFPDCTPAELLLALNHFKLEQLVLLLRNPLRQGALE